ncbi:MAG: FAD-dependent oxidoreductase, partial [Candidatus Nanopelagicales bacterium]
LNSDLTTSRIWLDEVLRYFVLGRPGLPKYGMQEIPNQLSRGITDFIKLNTKVNQVETNQVVSSDQSWSAKYVVLATDPVTTAQLLGTTPPMMNSVSTHYFSIKHRNRGPRTKLLAIDGSASPGPAVNSVVLTDAATSYAPAGYDLVATSVIDANSSVDLAQVQSHTALLHTLNPADLNLISSFEIPAALPQTDYVDKAKLKSFKSDGIYVASDLITTPSINGAISSGQMVADDILLTELKG